VQEKQAFISMSSSFEKTRNTSWLNIIHEAA
jgi:hypothetical protein